jgi:hypothetical protein
MTPPKVDDPGALAILARLLAPALATTKKAGPALTGPATADAARVAAMSNAGDTADVLPDPGNRRAA